MTVGAVINPKRVRMQANERLDTIDVDVVSVGPREHLDAYSRAVEATPRNVGSSTPTGLVFQGFGLTLNPTGASDGKVRVQSALGVAFDADGRMLIKETGVQVDLTLAAGNSQVYAYYVEGDSDSAVRRRISVGSPFTESGASIPTKTQSGVGFHTRAGDQTSIVASDVINGATTALCFLGVANNAAGTVTMVGYDPTAAPNGSFATNRITTVPAPALLPPAPAANGSVATIQGLVSAVAYMLGQAVWRGSSVTPPSVANNFQAWAPHTSSVAQLAEYLAAGHFHGASIFDSTVEVAGLLTADAGVAVTGNVSVTGDVGHGVAHEITLGPADFELVDGTGATLFRGEGTMANTVGNTVHYMASLPLPVGSSLTSLTGDVFDNNTGPTQIVLHLRKTVPSAGGFITIASAASSGAGAFQTVPIAGLPLSITAGGVYYVVFESVGGTAAVSVSRATARFTRPV